MMSLRASALPSCTSCSTVLDTFNSVQFEPCRCQLCKDCMITALAAVQGGGTPWKCTSCDAVIKTHTMWATGKGITSHVYDVTVSSESTPPSNAPDPVSRKRALPRSAPVDPRPFAMSPPQPVIRNKPFEERLQELKEYKEKFGNIYHLTQTNGPNLYSWTVRVRSGKCKLTPEQKEQLDALGFRWGKYSDKPLEGESHPPILSIKISSRDKTFDDRCEDLVAFKEINGHCRVKRDGNQNDNVRSLGEWVANIRSGKFTMTDEQKQKLTRIGFDWEKRKQKLDKAWKARFAELVDYKARFGHTRVPFEWAEDKQLADWVCTQRKAYRKGKLRQERKEALEEISFSWTGRNVAHASTPLEDSMF